jgi:hypothetical protein
MSRDLLRGVVTILLLFFASMIVFKVFYEVKQDGIDYYVELLGDKLLSMVPEGSGKEKLDALYGEFLSKVKNREVTPQQVERVAANILNASKVHDTLSAERAEEVLQLAFYPVQERKMAQGSDSLSNAKWLAAGERLKTVILFDDEIRRKVDLMKSYENQVKNQFQYRVTDGLVIEADPGIKFELIRLDAEKIAQELEKLEKQRIVEWKEDFDIDKKNEMERLKIEIKVIENEIEKQIEIKELNIAELQKALHSLNSFKLLNIPPPSNIDSLMKSVELYIKIAEIQSSAPQK